MITQVRFARKMSTERIEKEIEENIEEINVIKMLIVLYKDRLEYYEGEVKKGVEKLKNEGRLKYYEGEVKKEEEKLKNQQANLENRKRSLVALKGSDGGGPSGVVVEVVVEFEGVMNDSVTFLKVKVHFVFWC